jgi:hypothetical protein
MKSKILISFLLSVLTGFSADVAISGLPSSTSPSTNTLLEIADMNASPKSLKITLENLAFSALTNTTTLTTADLGGRVGLYPTNIANAQIASGAAIARSKVAAGTASQVVINDGSGNLTSEATLGATRFPALTGDITTPGGSLATTLKNTGSAGTYTKVTTDAQGRVTSGTSAVLNSADYVNQGSTTTLLHGNAAGNPSFAAVSLANDITGVLGATHGGAGTVNGIMQGDGAGNVSAVTIGANLTYSGGTLSASGGTGGGTGSTTNNLEFAIEDFGGGTNVADNTAALQLAYDTLLGGSQASSNYTFTVRFKMGVYQFTSAPKNFDNTENCVIAIPCKTLTGSSAATMWSSIRLVGADSPPYVAGSAGNGTIPDSGTVFNITTTASTGSFIRSRTLTTHGTYNVNNPLFENITFRGHDPTHLVMLDLGFFSGFKVVKCSFTVTQAQGSMSSPNMDSCAINGADEDGSEMNVVQDVSIEGYGKAIRIGEHFRSSGYLNIVSCLNGVCMKASNFGSSISYLYTGHNTTNILVEAAGPGLVVDHWDIEDSGVSSWKITLLDIADLSGTGGITANFFKYANGASATANRELLIGGNGYMLLRNIKTGDVWSHNNGNFGFRGPWWMHANGNDAIAASLALYKLRGTEAAPTAVANGDSLGQLVFGGYDGTTFPGVPTAYLYSSVIGSVSAANIPTQLGMVVGHSTAAGFQMTWDETNGTVSSNKLTIGLSTWTRGVIKGFLSTTATLDFPSTSAQTSSELTVTVTGAAANDTVTIGPPTTVNANCDYTGYVSAADTVTVRLNNYSSGAIDPASATFRVGVVHY